MACHRAPEFDIDPSSGNNGIIGSLGGGTDFTNTRSPSLRDLVDASGTPHGGFMHDASLPNLHTVVDHYNSIPAIVTGLDPRLTRPGGPGQPPQPQRLNFTQADKDNLVAFLLTLTGSAVYTDEKWSDPFEADGSMPFVVLPSESMTLTIFKLADETSTTLTTTGVPNVAYLLQASVDMDQWDSFPVTASPFGKISATLATPNEESRCFYRLVYAPTD